MKKSVKVLTVLAIVLLFAGIMLVSAGQAGFAGIIWAVSALISGIAYRLEKGGSRDKTQK